MINYTVIWVSKTSTKAIKQLEDEYIKRIKRFAKINIIEIKESPSKNPIEKSEKEANDVFNKLPNDSCHLISIQFYNWIINFYFTHTLYLLSNTKLPISNQIHLPKSTVLFRHIVSVHLISNLYFLKP